MPFITKLDYSDNRQIKQREKTSTDLFGATVFGLPFSGLTSGVDTSNTGTTETYDTVTGNTFSGNASTTIFTWDDSRMSLADSSLSAITPLNSGVTQDSGVVFTTNTSTIIDGNTVYLSYSGISLQEISVTEMSEVSPGNYTGKTSVDRFDVYSGGSLDFTGRTIWVDSTEITRTDRLILTRGAQPGYVWTCLNSEGMGYWEASSGGTSGGTNTFTTGTTLVGTTLYFDRNDSLSAYTADLSSIGSGESNTASNIGGGEGLFSGKSGVDLQFKTLTSTGGTITISSTGATVNLEAQASSTFSYRSTTVSGSVLTNDWTVDVTTTGDTTQTLPTAVGITGKVFNIKNSDVTETSTITLATNGSELIDGTYGNGTDLIFKFPVAITVQSTGTGWIII